MGYFRSVCFTIKKIISYLYIKVWGGECPCCNQKVSFWKPYGTKKLRMNAECPLCRAAERDRLQMVYWRKNIDRLADGVQLLHFAPEKIQYSFFSGILKNEKYWTVDIDDSIDIVKKKEDITEMSWQDNTFDFIICNQVLEHVLDDGKAILELARVLKKGGVCIITVPINNNNKTLQDARINTDDLRIKYYGESNHVRMYGLDFSNILLEHGLISKKVYAKDLMDRNTYRKYGLKKNEFFWLCEKKTELPVNSNIGNSKKEG